MQFARLILIVLLAQLFVGGNALAQVVIYTDEAEFVAATGAVAIPAPPPSTMEIYPCMKSDISGCGEAVFMPISSGNIIITAPRARDTWAFIHTLKNPIGLYVREESSYDWGIMANGHDDLIIVFPEAVENIGFKIQTNYVAEEYVTFYDVNGGVVGKVNDDQLDTAPSSSEFIGFSFDVPVQKIYIDNTRGDDVNEVLRGIYLVGENSQSGGDSQQGEGETCDTVVENAFNEGRAQGYSDGYQVGTSDGYNNGYTEGYSEGETVGYNQGVIDGVSECQADPASCDIAAKPGQGNGAINPSNGGLPPGQNKKQ